MKKTIAIILTTITIVTFFGVRTETTKTTIEETYFGDCIDGTYVDMELTVTEIDDDIIYGVDNNGDEWGFYGCCFEVGQRITVILETETQKIVEVRG